MDKKAIVKAIRRSLNMPWWAEWDDYKHDVWVWRTGRCPRCDGGGVSFMGGPDAEGIRVPEKDQPGVPPDMWYAYQCHRCKGTGRRPNRLERKRAERK